MNFWMPVVVTAGKKSIIFSFTRVIIAVSARQFVLSGDDAGFSSIHRCAMRESKICFNAI
jgi:hypothetical protein